MKQCEKCRNVKQKSNSMSTIFKTVASYNISKFRKVFFSPFWGRTEKIIKKNNVSHENNYENSFPILSLTTGSCVPRSTHAEQRSVIVPTVTELLWSQLYKKRKLLIEGIMQLSKEFPGIINSLFSAF